MTPLYHPRPERWHQFSVRTLFIGMTLACAGLWLGLQVKWLHERESALEWVNRRGMALPYPQDSSDPPRILRVFGVRGIAKIWLTPEDSATDEARLRKLFPETKFFGRYDQRTTIFSRSIY